MKLKYVSGGKIRNSLDANFGVIGSRKIFPYISKGDIWFDKRYIKEKIHFLKIHLFELKLMEKMSYEKARKIVNKKFLQKVDKIPDFILGETRYKGFKVKYVRGEIVRKFIDPKFILGCHSILNKRIGKKEIWIDIKQGKREMKYTLIHEYEEAKLMKKGMSYNNAHDFALAYEKMARRKDGASYPMD